MNINNISSYKIYELREFCIKNNIEVTGDRRRRDTFISEISFYFLMELTKKPRVIQEWEYKVEKCSDGAFYNVEDTVIVYGYLEPRLGAVPVYHNQHDYDLALEMSFAEL